MRRRLLLAIGLITFSTLGGGCWDVAEINRRAIVIAVGLDAVPAGRVRVTIQVPVMASMLPPTAGGGAGGGKTFHILTSEGESAYAAVPGLQSRTMNALFFGQVKTVVVGAELARRNIVPFLDFLRRHPEIPPQAIVVLAKGEAKDLLSGTHNSQELPGLVLTRYFMSPNKADLAYPMPAWQLQRTLEDGPEDPFLPWVAYEKGTQAFALHGLGVFHHRRLAGELSDVETRMFGLLSGKARNTSFTVLTDLGRVAYRKVMAKTKRQVQVQGETIALRLQVRVNGFLIEVRGDESRLGTKDVERIEEATARVLKREMEAAVRRLQQLNADILGLGELVRATRPQIWRRIDWDEEFPRLPVRIEVSFGARQTGTYR